MEPSNKDQEKKKISEVKILPVQFLSEENQENISINTNTSTQPYKEQITNQAFKFHSEGNISEAIKYYQIFINKGFKDHRVFSNYGIIVKNLGKLQKAELLQRKAIEINPNFADAHSNLGNTLNDLGKSEQAELSYRKAIEIKPDYVEAST